MFAIHATNTIPNKTLVILETRTIINRILVIHANKTLASSSFRVRVVACLVDFGSSYFGCFFSFSDDNRSHSHVSNLEQQMLEKALQDSMHQR
jgi:hypothetical protein